MVIIAPVGFFFCELFVFVAKMAIICRKMAKMLILYNWKEKSVEDTVTLKPMARATLVLIVIGHW